jgi:hypothetical protein
MSWWDKMLNRVLSGQSDANINFNDLRKLLLRLGYLEHIKGDQHIFRNAEQLEIVDLQPQKDGKAKLYQVRQVRAILLKYGITRAP